MQALESGKASVRAPIVVVDSRGYRVAKRCLDLGVCLLLLPLLLPLLALTGLAIRLDSRGPALFVQDRVGRAGCVIRIYKFRTMPHGIDRTAHAEHLRSYVRGEVPSPSEADLETYKPQQATQLTTVGRVLRRTSLDELPQVINVLKGEMSLVGPRPNLLAEVEAYEPWHRQRLAVLPGMTGLAQVRGRSLLSFDRIVEYDLEYIQQRNLCLDLKILGQTIPVVFSGFGAR